MQIGIKSDVGQVRHHNEDSFGLPTDIPPSVVAEYGELYIVADGVGGASAGEVASCLAVETIQATYYAGFTQRRKGAKGLRQARYENALVQAVQAANQAVYAQAQHLEQGKGMGTTVVAAVVLPSANTARKKPVGQLVVAHVGDSRAYLWHDQQLDQLTADDSWVAQQVRDNILTPEEAANHDLRSLLLRVVGREPSVEVSVNSYPFKPEDMFLLCSDGLTSCLSDQEIADTLAVFAPQAAAHRLVNLCNERGAPDNVTVLIGHYPAPPDDARESWITRLWKIVGGRR